MTQAELFEELRAMLREPQSTLSVATPFVYDDPALILQVRSALRHLDAKGVPLTVTMSEDGTLSGEMDNLTGILVALRAASTLLRGDLIQRVVSGQLGVVFRMGSDLIDTKTAAMQFKQAASTYDEEFRTMLTLALSGEGGVFGGPFAPGQ